VFVWKTNPYASQKQGVSSFEWRALLGQLGSGRAFTPVIRQRLDDVHVLPALAAAPINHKLPVGGQSHLPDPRRLPAAFARKIDSLVHNLSGPESPDAVGLAKMKAIMGPQSNHAWKTGNLRGLFVLCGF
jgi:hypothetical protein